jgi:hypothetical protein
LVFRYVGVRSTGASGGVYPIVGPDWNGQVPSGMTQIKNSTYLTWISNRIFVNGTSDLPNVHAIQNQIGLVPLYVLQGKPASPSPPSHLSLDIFNSVVTS